MSDLPYHSREKRIDTVPEAFLAIPPNVSPYHKHHIGLSFDQGMENVFYYFTFVVNISRPDIMLEVLQK